MLSFVTMKVIIFYEKKLWRKVFLLYKDEVPDLSQSYKLSYFSNLWNCQVFGLRKKWLFCNKNIYMILNS